ncbi:M23 family metallopeptidase [Nocardia stercoris]|uniref:M23 family metallopeptidase n=1 Tax=Nocardia stercoris TaxID=2483361 RepID=UPI001F45F2AD|nr:peptidoglycan DD-metalloendopeptidase family protein [Nocardia stercoris]
MALTVPDEDDVTRGRAGDTSGVPAEPHRINSVAGGTALLLSVVALGITVHAATGTPPARTSTPAPTLMAAPGPGEPLPAAAPAPGTQNPADRNAAQSAPGSQSAPDPLVAWARQRAAVYDIPEQALYAYGHATTALQATQPNCHLGWTTLAAIAATESNHARYGGASIAPNGQVGPPIRGVPLDGTHGNANITAPGANGRPAYVRAEGPFQFLPDTWKRWGLAAGTPNPQLTTALTTGSQATGAANGNPDNINDAALAAARYLCADNHDLATPAGWTSAILAYNHSGAYLDRIHSTAIRYTGGYAKPVTAVLTSGFGSRWGTFHNGIDLAAPIGTPIFAVTDATVVDAGPAQGFGLWIRLRHPDGTVTVYGHVNTMNVTVGQHVSAGQQIATVGNRGDSTGPHLHFEVHPNGGGAVDPQPWLAARAITYAAN